MKANKYLIIGGVATGASVAARLRRLDEDAEIIMIDKGHHVSYSNCSLPYRISNVVDEDQKLVLMDSERFKQRYNIEVRVLSEAFKINEREKTVLIHDIETDTTYEEQYDKLVIAPGANAIVPNFPGLEAIDHFVLKTVTNTTKLMNFLDGKKPSHMTVIGGGFIGIEVAENLQMRGIEVTLIEGSKQLMQPLDYEFALFAKKALEDKGIKVILDKLVTSFSAEHVYLNDGSVVETDGVVLAIGVRPDTAFLKDTSIELAKSGHIVVNDNYQTSNCDIYAGGDAILVRNKLLNTYQPLPLAGPANKQGRLIADHICNRKFVNKGYIGSSVIKIFDLTFAQTGLNEKQIISSETPIDYQVAYITATDKVSLMPNVNGINMKLIFESGSGKVLGAQAFSKGNVDKRIDVIATAIKFDATVYDLYDLELVYAPHHGTGKDVVNKIGYLATNLLEGLYKQVVFTDVYDLVLNKAQLIDVREQTEFAAAHVSGFKNIPMSEFRTRLDELDLTKPVYISCQSGLRSYNVVMALTNLGYDAYNVAGGYNLISSYEVEMQKLNSNRKDVLKNEKN